MGGVTESPTIDATFGSDEHVLEKVENVPANMNTRAQGRAYQCAQYMAFAGTLCLCWYTPVGRTRFVVF